MCMSMLLIYLLQMCYVSCWCAYFTELTYNLITYDICLLYISAGIYGNLATVAEVTRRVRARTPLEEPAPAFCRKPALTQVWKADDVTEVLFIIFINYVQVKGKEVPQAFKHNYSLLYQWHLPVDAKRYGFSSRTVALDRTPGFAT